MSDLQGPDGGAADPGQSGLARAKNGHDVRARKLADAATLGRHGKAGDLTAAVPCLRRALRRLQQEGLVSLLKRIPFASNF
jgi:DNA-binding GntR family transcriptional regulator